MFRYIVIGLVAGAFLTVAACGVSEEEYQQVAAERETVKKELEEAKEENRVLNDAILEIYKEREVLKKQISNCESQMKNTPATTPPPPDTENEDDLYIVQPGDTLGHISNLTGIPVDTLRELNADRLGPWLMPGQKIRIR